MITSRSRTRRHRLVALPIAVALVAAACGGDDDDDTGTEATTVTEVTTATEATTGTEATTATEATAQTSTESTAAIGATTDDATASGDGLTPVPEGVDLDAEIVMAFSVPPLSLDPVLGRDAGSNSYQYMMYDRLTEIGPDLEIVPYLATEWAYSEDGTSFTMQLREDAKFHDGTPFDAAAAVANINRALTLEGSALTSALAGVAGVEATGPYEITFSTPDGTPGNLPALLAGRPGAMMSPAFIENPTIDLQTEVGPVGSGPYMATEFRPGQGVSYERAPNYWDPGRQLAAKFSIDLVDPAARINGVQDGTFDLGQSAATDSLQAIELGESGAFNYVPIVINTVYGALFNPGLEGALSSLEFRQAIMHAMDRDAINEGLFEGRCEPRWQSFPAGNKYFFPEIEERYPYDPELARQLLAESGVTDPTFDIQVSPGSYEPFAQVMQAQLGEVGITMNIVPSETAAVPTNFITGTTAAAYLVMLAYPDPASLFTNWIGGTFGNLLNPEVPEAAAIREAAAAANNATLSEDEQLAAWEQIYTDIQELAVFAPSCAAPQVWMSDPSVIGVAEMPFIWQGSVVPYTIGKLAE